VTLLQRILFALFILVSAPLSASAELAAKNLLLVVNRNAPDGVSLAIHYARQRGVPPEQIVQLDLPTGDEITLDDYERLIADPLRLALSSAAYAANVKCIVTFYGVPFRIPPRLKVPAVEAELKFLAAHRNQIEPKLAALAQEAERLAKEVDPHYSALPTEADSVSRVRQAALASAGAMGRVADPARRKELEQAWQGVLGAGRESLNISEPPAADIPATQKSDITETMRRGAVRVYDPVSRRLLRADARRLGSLIYMQVLESQLDYLSNDQTDAAVDSELACLRWNIYRRPRWQGNPLRFDAPPNTGAPPTLMVMRLDGPGVKVVKKVIDDGIAVETAGLDGKIVIDSRNIAMKKPDGSIDGYGRYDETLRNLRDILARGNCSLPVTFDDSDKLIPDDSLEGIAVYCGWYDADKVHLPGKFVRGAVGFHVASYTGVAIRNLGGGLWTSEMLNNGVVSTLGAVSEPYLTAFPDADSYVPLLLTGKLTMAEVYWRTAPMTSWKITVIGDPLYNPFRAGPALKPEALPKELLKALSDP